MKRIALLTCVLLMAPAAQSAGDPSLANGSVLEAVEHLKPGEYLWMPQAAPQGPMLMIVNVRTQRAVLYRNGVPIAVSTVSTGRDGHATPLGAFTVLQKRATHHSNLYDSAPMPYMQRLTWDGVALHGGQIPGYPASHGCIRLPNAFARLLFGETRLGMTVVVTEEALAPALAPGSPLPDEDATGGRFAWYPDRSVTGPLSVVISVRDRRLIVLRSGVPIGWADVAFRQGIDRPYLFSLVRAADAKEQWTRIPLPGQDASAAPPLTRESLVVPAAFRRELTTILTPGTTVIVTPDSFRPSEAISALLDGEEAPVP